MKDTLLDTANKIVGKAVEAGFDESMVLVEDKRESMLKIANSEPSVIQFWDSVKLKIYLAKNKRIITVEVDASDPSMLDKPFEELINYAGRIMESPFYAPIPEPVEVKPLPELVDDRIIEYMGDPSSLGELVIEAAHRERIDYVAGMIDLSHREKALVTSRDGEYYEESTGMTAYLRAFAGEDGSGQWSACSTKLRRDKLEEMAETAAKYAFDSRNRVDIEPGVYDIVFSPMIMGNLIGYIARMASAFSVFMGMSIFMKAKPGEKVASEKLTLIDDPHNTELPNSTSFDDEGIPTKPKRVIETGVLKTLLHNTKTASKMNTVSTGNAGWISPHPWNLVIPGGDYSLKELISDVRRGLLINNNWYTRLQNHVEGIFSTITRDALFLIENGRVTKPVKKIRIADTFPNLLKNISAIGGRTYDIRWWEVRWPTRIPYILARNIHTSKHII